MLNDTLKRRLSRDRKMTSITLRIPQDVVDSMKAIAPVRGMSGYQTLLKSYISEGLRRDEAEYLSADATARLAEALKARGVDPKVVEQAVRDVRAACRKGVRNDDPHRPRPVRLRRRRRRPPRRAHPGEHRRTDERR